MKTLSYSVLALAATAAMLFQTASASADQTVVREVPGQKIDSGLGDLPHYRTWADPSGKTPMQAPLVVGQKIDSGLGDLPHYRYWTDPTGKMPVRTEQVVAEATLRK